MGRAVPRHELSDRERESLAALITACHASAADGGPGQVINRMAYKIPTGNSGRDLPERYGPRQTVCTRAPA
jgi:transposase